ncbi:MAG: hypothetical protein M0Z77_08840 [Thermoplasmatales archaeon]|nr:hypothetical protein [Thermoplasmatales archaeon]
MNEGIPDTGYDKKLNVNYRILLETLRELDYDDFLRACPRYVEFVTEVDIEKLLIFEGVAENWSGEEITIPDNPMDHRQFTKIKGEIVGAITREIKRGDPRNLEYEAVENAMMDMNNLTANVIEKVVTSEPFVQRIQEAIAKRTSQGEESNEDLVGAVNQLNHEFTEVKEKLEKMEKVQSARSVTPLEKPKESHEPVQEILKISLKVKRTWGIKANDADNSIDIHEKREKEEGGDINVEMTDGNGSVIWKVRTTQLGHSVLYERIKKVLVEFLAVGEISTDLTHSLPKENEGRNFMPEMKNGSVWMIDNWPVKRGLFNQKYERPLSFIVGSSSWTVDIRMKMSDVIDVKSALTGLMDMILLSGEETSKNDNRSFK